MDEKFELKRCQVTGLYYQVPVIEPEEDDSEEVEVTIPPKKVKK